MPDSIDRRKLIAAGGAGLLLGAGVLGTPDFASAQGVSVAGELNVKDFGAVGDGSTDDTEAIRAAVAAAQNAKTGDQYPGSVWYATQPVVLFPPGAYRLSDTIRLGGYDRLRGTGNPRLVQSDNDKDILLLDSAYKNLVEGLSFVDGRRAISINTHNLDTSQQVIRDCQFYGSHDCAIHTEESPSTLLVIEGCVFLACMSVLRNCCDKATLMDCWITSNQDMVGRAVIENRGVLHLERMLGVPLTNWEADQRWIDNWGTVACVRVRFGGEGAGFCAVNNYARYDSTYPINPNAIYLEDCQVYCIGNNARKAAIYCNEIPNMITVRNCHGIIDIPLVMVDAGLNLDTYFDEAAGRPDCCRYLIQDNSVAEVWQRLPEQMRAWQTGLEPLKGTRPNTGHRRRGDLVINQEPGPLAPLGWVCTEPGTPGKWQDVGLSSGFSSETLPGEPQGDGAHIWRLPLPSPLAWSALVTVTVGDDVERRVFVGLLSQSTVRTEAGLRARLVLTPLQSPGDDLVQITAGLNEGAPEVDVAAQPPTLLTLTAAHRPGNVATLRIVQMG